VPEGHLILVNLHLVNTWQSPVLSDRSFYRHKWSRITSISWSPLRSTSITEASSLLWGRL